MDVDHEERMRAYMERLWPKEVRWRYFQSRRGPMFVWTVEPFNLRDKTDKAQGKYESVVYVPYGKGSRSGKGERWKRDESTSTLHELRRDAKARALKLYREWLETGGKEARNFRRTTV